MIKYDGNTEEAEEVKSFVIIIIIIIIIMIRSRALSSSGTGRTSS